MPSPFPGMDSYFEGNLWTSFHTQFGVEIARQLTPKLAPRYVARAEKRFLVENPENMEVEIERIIPDVGVRQASSKASPTRTGTIAAAPMELATVLPSKVPHVWVEIRDTDRQRLVTAIEFLSPTNKQGGNRRQYLRKRNAILRSAVHLMEIDLVRRGKRPPMKGRLPDAPYFVFLARSERRPILEIWPIAFGQPLPTIPVPLKQGEPDASLDLQQAMNNFYDLNRFDLDIDYSAPPEVPLPEEAAAWARELMEARDQST